MAGNLPLAIDASIVRTIHHEPRIEPIPACRSWFCGLARVGIKLLPVTDLGGLFDAPLCCGPLLELDPALAVCGLRVEHVSGFLLAPAVKLSTEYEKTEPQMVNTLLDTLLLDMPPLLHDDIRHWPLDIERLLVHEHFLDIGPGPAIAGAPL